MEITLSEPAPLLHLPTSLMKVRFFQKEYDTLPLLEALQEIWPGYLLPESELDPNLTLLAFVGQELVGAIICEAWNDKGFINQLFIKPFWQRQGIARALLLQALAIFYQRGYRSVRLEGSEENRVAHHLYESVGMYDVWHGALYQKEIAFPGP